MQLNKVYRLLALCFGFFTAVPIFAAAGESVGKKYNWLIFGAGGERDAAYFNKFFEGKPIQWQGFDLYQCKVNCITGNFNNIEDLKKLPDNHYDVILFDGYTVGGWLNWTGDHLKLIKEKLTDPGILLIPDEAAKLIQPDPGQNVGERETLNTTLQEYVPRHKLNNEALFVGTNLPLFKPTTMTMKDYTDKLPSSYLMFSARSINRRKLQTIFGKSDSIVFSKIFPSKLFYPVVSVPLADAMPKNFYIGVKSSGQESVQDVFDRLIKTPLGK